MVFVDAPEGFSLSRVPDASINAPVPVRPSGYLLPVRTKVLEEHWRAPGSAHLLCERALLPRRAPHTRALGLPPLRGCPHRRAHRQRGTVDGRGDPLRAPGGPRGTDAARQGPPGGPGITQSDLLVINKTDLAELVGAELSVMDRDSKKMRGDGRIVFAQARNNVGIDEICEHILSAWRAAIALAG